MAADFLDNAVDLQAALNHTALQYQLKQNRFHIKSLTHCTDCDVEIEQARQALGGVERCTECEGFHQRELFQKSQRVG
jgi:phage/conjugal plasmid C-4 type zinc finger TraR family protein